MRPASFNIDNMYKKKTETKLLPVTFHSLVNIGIQTWMFY